MSILTRSNCRIQHISNDETKPNRDFPDESIIQIRQSDTDNDYYIQALDNEVNGTEIFNIVLTDRDTYRCDPFDDGTDVINDDNDTYQIFLNESSRGAFYSTLHTIYDMLFSQDDINIDSSSTSSTIDLDSINPTTDFDFRNLTTVSNYGNMDAFHDYSPATIQQSQPIHQIQCDPKDILTDVRNLNRSIEQGNSDDAARIIKQFITQGVHLCVDPSKQLQNEKEFPILVQLDGNEYGVFQHGPEIPVNVFPSTTIRELRAAFEVGYQQCPSSQYIFVNGNLVHDDLTMKDINVGEKSLFILYLITYPRQFHSDGPWKCSLCSIENQGDSLRCALCSASRRE